MKTFEEHIRLHITEYWSEHCGAALGYIDMPVGYALMKSESGWFYWLRKDGVESLIYCYPIHAMESSLKDKDSMKNKEKEDK